MHLGTIQLLREWARWGEAHNISFPSLSPMFGERALKSPLFGIGHIPPDVMRVELAVCQIEWGYRNVLILRYQRHLTWRQMGSRISLDWRTAQKRTQAAENEVHHKLTVNPCRNVPTKVRFVRFFKTVSAKSPA